MNRNQWRFHPRIHYKPRNSVNCLTLFEPDRTIQQQGYSLNLYLDQIVVSKTERLPADQGGGYATWYPFRFRWFPSFKGHRNWQDGFRNLGWVTRKHWGDEGKKPWMSKRSKRLYAQACQDFKDASHHINTLPYGEGRYPTSQTMQDAARRQNKYLKYPRR